MKLNETIAYSMGFCSFILHEAPELIKRVDSVILFGSGARDEIEGESDIDLFFEVKQDSREIEDKLEDLKEKFYMSNIFLDYWQVVISGDYPFSLKVGNFDEWENLYPALLAEGISIYGKFSSSDYQGKTRVLFFWENISGNERIYLYKTLFGYRSGKKKYAGLLEQYGALRISKGSILVPLEASAVFRNVFKKYGIPANEKIVMEVT